VLGGRNYVILFKVVFVLSIRFGFKYLSRQGYLGIGKKYKGSIFFAKASLAGLTNYVIRHNSKYGNMTSLSGLPPACSPHASQICFICTCVGVIY